MHTQPDQSKKAGGVTGVAIPACLLIGIGVGFLIENVAAGVLIGLGAGFFVMMVLRALLGDW